MPMCIVCKFAQFAIGYMLSSAMEVTRRLSRPVSIVRDYKGGFSAAMIDRLGYDALGNQLGRLTPYSEAEQDLFSFVDAIPAQLV